jgi:hypothetical protein
MFEKLILEAGAEYLGEQNGSVKFKDRQTGRVLTLYTHALKTAKDVEMALKAVREPVVGFEPLERSE